MSQPIVVVAATEPDSPSADFAAGAATVVAAAAADAALEATAEAAHADARATEAAVTASEAFADADDAHDRIDRIEAFLEDLVIVLNDGLPEAAAAELPEAPDDGAPPPAEPAGDPEPATAPDKPRRERSGKWGADGWFGSRG